ncbi:MAG: septum formation initiator family protein [Acidiferrobacteraceae bacterium]
MGWRRLRRVFLYASIALLALLQYDLWLGRGSVRSVWRLHQRIVAAQARNARRAARNDALAAQVADLKQHGRASVESEARTTLGMIRRDETFYQVVPGSPPTTPFVPYPDGAGRGYGKASN